jgi:hypothetical protein
MKYYFSKSKFANQLFFKKIQGASIEHTSGLFQISTMPFLHYSGKYHIHSVTEKDKNRTLYLTMKSQNVEVDFVELNNYNQFFVSISHDGKKAMVFNKDAEGIILKS